MTRTFGTPEVQKGVFITVYVGAFVAHFFTARVGSKVGR